MSKPFTRYTNTVEEELVFEREVRKSFESEADELKKRVEDLNATLRTIADVSRYFAKKTGNAKLRAEYTMIADTAYQSLFVPKETPKYMLNPQRIEYDKYWEENPCS